ncbi:MAG: ComF family protein [Clostridia bacterium]|nr:ComF family protein [Clostridia bacterium]
MRVTLWERLLLILFPKRCAFCNKVIRPDRDLCADCAALESKISGQCCLHCGLPETRCQCRKHAHFYDGIAAAYVYSGEVQRGILRYKDGGNRRTADFMAQEMARRFREAYTDKRHIDYIAYVPHTDAEVRRRGFDQNLEIAQKLSAELRIPLFHGFVKLYEIAPQKAVSFMYKRGNTAGVFDITAPNLVAGKRFLLCDDILTSGSTLGECAKMLKLYDAEQVCALTFAVVERDRKRNERKIK